MLQSKFRIRTDERYALFLSFLCCFCVLGSYYIMRPIRDQLAVGIGSAHLPWVFTVTFLATLLLSPLFSWIVCKWPRRIVMPSFYLFIISCQLLLMSLFREDSLRSTHAFGMTFFVYVSVCNLFMVSVFWSFMTDIWSNLQARRLFPIIAFGGTLGAITGPFITSSLVVLIGSVWLLGISIILLCGAVICVILLGKWAHSHSIHKDEPDSEDALGGRMWDGLKQLISNPFVASMALIMLLSDAIGTIAYALVIDYSGMAFPNQAISQTRFAANIDLVSNFLQVIVQLTVTRWLLVRYGAGFVFLFCALLVMLACLMMAGASNQYAPIIGIMPPVAVLLIFTRSLSHGMLVPARESLYTLVMRDVRYKGKNTVDTIVWRAGDIMSLLSLNGLRKLGVTIVGFEIIWAVLAGMAGWIGWKLAQRVQRN
ncbi:MAG: MFS transporter [Parachlamydia sp.]|nr:MFS transporter [Parachlamydia sp.]